MRQSADIGGVRKEPGGYACDIAIRSQAAERHGDEHQASGPRVAGFLDRRRPSASESRREKDEWAVTSSEASDEDHLSGRGEKQISRVRKRIASRGAILGRSATFGRQIIVAGVPLSHDQTEDGDSDEWRPKRVLTCPNNTSSARSTQGSLRPESLEGLSKRKRPRSGLLCAESNPEEKCRRRQKAKIPESSKLKSADSSIIVDMRDSKLSSSQRGHYEIISNATSSAAESANPPGKGTAVAPSRPASESIGSMAPRSKKRKRKTARSPSADRDIAVAHPVTESVGAASNDDDLLLAQSKSVAAHDKPHSDISREGSPQLSAASSPTSKGRKVAKRRRKVGSEDDYIAGEESDFEPASRTSKIKTKKGRKSRKGGPKVTRTTKQSSGSTKKDSTKVDDESDKTLSRETGREQSDPEQIGLGPPSSTPLMAKDVNMAPPNKTIAAAAECRMMGVDGQDDKVAMTESSCPAQATSTAIMSPIAAGNSVTVDRKSGSDRKIAYRVGLSKSARIQPLLRIMRK